MKESPSLVSVLSSRLAEVLEEFLPLLAASDVPSSPEASSVGGKCMIPQPELPYEGLLTKPEIARFLGVDESTVFKLMKEGMPHVRIRVADAKVGSPRFSRGDVMFWLRRRTYDNRLS